MWLPKSDDLEVDVLGPCRVVSPLRSRASTLFVNEDRRVLPCSDTLELKQLMETESSPAAFEPAGPRPEIFFRPEKLTCGIVTCGGLCPGINDVIRSLVLTLHYHYGVRRILGFRYGYAGLGSGNGHEPVFMDPAAVDAIHQDGGTFLGSSRGPQEVSDMIFTLLKYDVGILFVIGGDGSLKGARSLCEEIARRKLEIAVVGIPKTIDNDLEWTERTFGFGTAVEEARQVLAAAHYEAKGAWNGIGLVKLMGRHSGFIAVHATLANADVNFCLIPEVPFRLDGEGGFLQVLEERLESKHHAVIVVAEGAGQDLFDDDGEPERDASGNIRLKDVGVHLKERIRDYFAYRGKKATIKYIDPSYIIRSLPANSLDSQLCLQLGQHAVHAGMAGRTNLVVGYWNQRFTHLPIALAVSRIKRVDPEGHVWQRVMDATAQRGSIFRKVKLG
jgi:6-phosphofructokinase 1